MVTIYLISQYKITIGLSHLELYINFLEGKLAKLLMIPVLSNLSYFIEYIINLFVQT